MNETVIQRIVRLIKEKGMAEKKFCDYIGVSQSTFVNWKNRNTNPNVKYLPRAADFLSVTENYLITGEDGSYYTDKETDDLYEAIQTNPDIKFLLNASRQMTKEDLEAVVNVVKRMKGIND